MPSKQSVVALEAYSSQTKPHFSRFIEHFLNPQSTSRFLESPAKPDMVQHSKQKNWTDERSDRLTLANRLNQKGKRRPTVLSVQVNWWLRLPF